MKSTEVSIASANTVASATLCRVFNNSATVQVISANNGVAYYANLTIASFASEFIQKASTDTLTGTSCLAVSISFT